MEFKERTIISFSAFLLSRSQMPQVKWNTLKLLLDKASIEHEKYLSKATSFKPTQYEFDQTKVDSIKANWQSNNKKAYIIVSSDGYILDGHHRYFAALQLRTAINIIQIDLTINKLLKFVQDSNND